jgi:hypothetical protein
MVKKRQEKGPDWNSGIKDRVTRRQISLRKERISGRIFRKTVEPEIEK